jgi:hypothetical protein
VQQDLADRVLELLVTEALGLFDRCPVARVGGKQRGVGLDALELA